MSIRMTGLTSGLDTDSIVQALVSAQRTKQTKVKNKLTKSEWKQEIWKDLNTKIYSLYTGELTKFKTQGNYLTKKVTSSDESVATATATSSAGSGSHTLEVNKLAASQSVTSGKIEAGSDKATLTSLGMVAGTKIAITNANGKSKTLEVTDKTTISDFLSACKSADLNASFDKNQKRFFISAKNSGTESGFSITTQSGDVADKENALDKTASTVAKNTLDQALATIKAGDIAKLKTLAGMSGGTAIDQSDSELYEAYGLLSDAFGVAADGKTVDTYLQEYISQTEDKNNGVEGANPDAAWENFSTAAEDTLASTVFTEMTSTAEKYMEELKNASADQIASLLGEEVKDQDGNEIAVPISVELQEAFDYMSEHVKDKTAFQTSLSDYAETKEFVAEHGSTDQLTFLGLQNITADTESVSTEGMSFVKASDAEIVLDGAVLTGASNDFSVNGLSINLKNVTNGGKITLNATTDIDSVYNMVKDFVKKYNEILDELNEKYSADSAKGYDPLTDEQKEAMTEDQIEKWEKKIKDSLLRRDSTLDSIMTTMRSSLLTTTKVDGLSYSLSSFGIVTSSDYSEKGKLHIMGDPDDETYSTQTNKLKEALESNPEAVMKTLADAGQALYDNLTKKMAKTSLSSALTFYNDKQMSSEQTSYKKQISQMETKLTDLEDRYYKQFTAMEKAMSELNSQSSYLTSMMGGGN